MFTFSVQRGDDWTPSLHDAADAYEQALNAIALSKSVDERTEKLAVCDRAKAVYDREYSKVRTSGCSPS